MSELNKKNIGATIYYETPVHRTPFYNKKLELPNTDWAARHVLSLPVQPLVTIQDLELTAKIIRNVVP
jgi:dTDP-4-amino-4,6-dideoxygalactose transaminase